MHEVKHLIDRQRGKRPPKWTPVDVHTSREAYRRCWRFPGERHARRYELAAIRRAEHLAMAAESIADALLAQRLRFPSFLEA